MTEYSLDAFSEINTDRLLLRRYRESDAPAYHEACRRNREHLLPFEVGNPALGVDSVSRAVGVLRQFDVDWKAGRACFLGGWSRDDGSFICQIYVGIGQSTQRPSELTIGYFVDRDREGQGYVTEAVRAVLEVAFARLGFTTARLECNELNVRSARVAERCGFTRVGDRQRTHPRLPRPDGEPSGDILYELTASDWRRVAR